MLRQPYPHITMVVGKSGPGGFTTRSLHYVHILEMRKQPTNTRHRSGQDDDWLYPWLWSLNTCYCLRSWTFVASKMLSMHLFLVAFSISDPLHLNHKFSFIFCHSAVYCLCSTWYSALAKCWLSSVQQSVQHVYSWASDNKSPWMQYLEYQAATFIFYCVYRLVITTLSSQWGAAFSSETSVWATCVHFGL